MHEIFEALYLNQKELAKPWTISQRALERWRSIEWGIYTDPNHHIRKSPRGFRDGGFFVYGGAKLPYSRSVSLFSPLLYLNTLNS
jgi:hypothetical protein